MFSLDIVFIPVFLLCCSLGITLSSPLLDNRVRLSCEIFAALTGYYLNEQNLEVLDVIIVQEMQLCTKSCCQIETCNAYSYSNNRTGENCFLYNCRDVEACLSESGLTEAEGFAVDILERNEIDNPASTVDPTMIEKLDVRVKRQVDAGYQDGREESGEVWDPFNKDDRKFEKEPFRYDKIDDNSAQLHNEQSQKETDNEQPNNAQAEDELQSGKNQPVAEHNLENLNKNVHPFHQLVENNRLQNEGAVDSNDPNEPFDRPEHVDHNLQDINQDPSQPDEDKIQKTFIDQLEALQQEDDLWSTSSTVESGFSSTFYTSESESSQLNVDNSVENKIDDDSSSIFNNVSFAGQSKDEIISMKNDSIANVSSAISNETLSGQNSYSSETAINVYSTTYQHSLRMNETLFYGSSDEKLIYTTESEVTHDTLSTLQIDALKIDNENEISTLTDNSDFSTKLRPIISKVMVNFTTELDIIADLQNITTIGVKPKIENGNDIPENEQISNEETDNVELMDDSEQIDGINDGSSLQPGIGENSDNDPNQNILQQNQFRPEEPIQFMGEGNENLNIGDEEDMEQDEVHSSNAPSTGTGSIAMIGTGSVRTSTFVVGSILTISGVILLVVVFRKASEWRKRRNYKEVV